MQEADLRFGFEENQANENRLRCQEQASGHRDLGMTHSVNVCTEKWLRFGSMDLAAIMKRNHQILAEERRRGRPKQKAKPETSPANLEQSSESRLVPASASPNESPASWLGITQLVSDVVGSATRFITDVSNGEIAQAAIAEESSDGRSEPHESSRAKTDSDERSVRPKDYSHRNSAALHDRRPGDQTVSDDFIQERKMKEIPQTNNNRVDYFADKNSKINPSNVDTAGTLDHPLIRNSSLVRCAYCQGFIKKFEGVIMLKNCHKHRICKECVVRNGQLIDRCPIDECGARVTDEELAALSTALGISTEGQGSSSDAPDGQTGLPNVDDASNLSNNSLESSATEDNYLEKLGLADEPLWPTFTKTKCTKCTSVIPYMEGFILKNCREHKICKECFRTAIERCPDEPQCPLSVSCHGMISTKEIAAFVKLHGPVSSRSPRAKNTNSEPEWETPNPKKTAKLPKNSTTDSAGRKSGIKAENDAKNKDKNVNKKTDGGLFSRLMNRNERLSKS